MPGSITWEGTQGGERRSKTPKHTSTKWVGQGCSTRSSAAGLNSSPYVRHEGTGVAVPAIRQKCSNSIPKASLSCRLGFARPLQRRGPFSRADWQLPWQNPARWNLRAVVRLKNPAGYRQRGRDPPQQGAAPALLSCPGANQVHAILSGPGPSESPATRGMFSDGPCRARPTQPP